ncbi:MAG: hypothetical protein RMJ51_02305 [Candidatus Calescibacterium sp.]|nr:hypothetical protein [Candidatus Calescibacterium sp.]MDW8195059.1 hypothetical protein [Candidatus Calescibacterium sp.]
MNPNFTLFILDLLPPICTKVVNEIYNLNSDSPTTISLYYQINIKQNVFANEIDVIIDLLNTKDVESITQEIPLILESIVKKIENLKEYMNRNIENFVSIDKEETYQINKLIEIFERILSKIIVIDQSIYLKRGKSEIELITTDNDKNENSNILKILSNSFNQIKISVWNMYNAIKTADKPYIVEDKIDFLRKLENLIPIDYFLSDYLNYKVIEREFIEWLFLDIELEILSSLEYIQKEDLNFLKENTSNIITEIIYNLDEFSKVKDLYIELRQIYDQIKLLKLNIQLKCPICSNHLSNNQCTKCKTVFVDLITNISFIKTLFQATVIRDQKLFEELIDIAINGIKNSLNLSNSNLIKIMDKINTYENIPTYLKIKLNSIEMIEKILEKMEELKNYSVEEIDKISSILADIHLCIEKISLATKE